ncbi:MAG: flagellar export chaperone FlgN [Pseudomonadota bacterium]
MSYQETELRLVLRRNVESAEHLKVVLSDERMALTKRDSDALEVTAAAKTAASEQVAAAWDELLSWLRSAGLDTDTPGSSVAAAIEAAPPSTRVECAAEWRAFTQAAADIAAANQANGRILAIARQTATQVLDILSGTSDGGAVYDDGGTVDRTRGGRSITEI